MQYLVIVTGLTSYTTNSQATPRHMQAGTVFNSHSIFILHSIPKTKQEKVCKEK